MDSAEGSGPVNFALAERIARQQISASRISPAERTATEEAIRLADLWISDSTVLPAAEGPAAAWTASEWLSTTFPLWKRLVTPVAENMSEAQLASLPDEVRQMMGNMPAAVQQMSGMSFGLQLGNALGDLAQQALSGADLGIPVAPAGTVALLPQHIATAAKDLPVEARDLYLYVAAREAARQRLFQRVPWLVERIVSSVEEYADGLMLDTSHIEEASRNLEIDTSNPQALQNAIHELQNMNLAPRVSSTNAGAVSRLETLLALVEGWVEHVVDTALEKYLSSLPSLSEAWRRRTATGGSANQAFSQVVGIEFSAPRVREAAELWRRSDNAVGVQRRDAVWDHPDFLPTAEDLTNPAEFIDSLLDDADPAAFDPISEIEKLEAELNRQGSEAPKENPSETRKEQGGDRDRGDAEPNENGGDPRGESD